MSCLGERYHGLDQKRKALDMSKKVLEMRKRAQGDERSDKLYLLD